MGGYADMNIWLTFYYFVVTLGSKVACFQHIIEEIEKVQRRFAEDSSDIKILFLTMGTGHLSVVT